LVNEEGDFVETLAIMTLAAMLNHHKSEKDDNAFSKVRFRVQRFRTDAAPSSQLIDPCLGAHISLEASKHQVARQHGGVDVRELLDGQTRENGCLVANPVTGSENDCQRQEAWRYRSRDYIFGARSPQLPPT
jgi:hypothetical protein